MNASTANLVLRGAEPLRGYQGGLGRTGAQAPPPAPPSKICAPPPSPPSAPPKWASWVNQQPGRDPPGPALQIAGCAAQQALAGRRCAAVRAATAGPRPGSAALAERLMLNVSISISVLT